MRKTLSMAATLLFATSVVAGCGSSNDGGNSDSGLPSALTATQTTTQPATQPKALLAASPVAPATSNESGRH